MRRVVYATHLIESINARLRKVTSNRGQFPSEQAALKVLYLAVRNLEEFRSPQVGTGLEESATDIHDLLRGTHPHTMTATITYTNRLTLPAESLRTGHVLARGLPVTGGAWAGRHGVVVKVVVRRGVMRRDA